MEYYSLPLSDEFKNKIEIPLTNDIETRRFYNLEQD
jgi:hypothetical protein